jgi:fatty acid desaturase
MGTATALAENPTRRGSDYAALMREVRAAGLLERRRAYYWARIAIVGGAFAAGWVGFALLGDSWWQLLVAVFLAVVFGQLGFLGHDAGHRQIFRTRRANDLVGFASGNLAIGLSYSWWVDKHNRHHAHPNQEELDPDIDIGALAFTSAQAREKRGKVLRFIASHQRYLFFPLLLLESMQLHLSSVRALKRGGMRQRGLEIALLSIHIVAYFTAVFLVLSPLKAIAFMVVQQGLLGLYLGCAFAPNHKGMPILAVDDRTDFLRRQVLTSRNVRGGWLIDAALGGLNYQIEHHLFPSMPRPNLRRSQAMVRAFCEQHEIPYWETTLLRSYHQALTHLHEVGGSLRAGTGPTTD